MRIHLTAARPPVVSKGRPVTNVISTAKLRQAIDEAWQKAFVTYKAEFENATRNNTRVSGSWVASERIPLTQLVLSQTRVTPEIEQAFITVQFTMGGKTATPEASTKVIASGGSVVIKLMYKLPMRQLEATKLLNSLADEFDGSLATATDPAVIGDLVTRANRAFYDQHGVFDDIKSLYELEFKWSQLRALRDRTGPLADSAERELRQLEERLSSVLMSEAQHLYNALVFWLNDYDWKYSTDPQESPLILAYVLAQRDPRTKVTLLESDPRVKNALSNLVGSSDGTRVLESAVYAIQNGDEPFEAQTKEEYDNDDLGLKTMTLRLPQVLANLGLSDLYAQAQKKMMQSKYVQTYANAEKVAEGIEAKNFARLSTAQKIIAYHKALTTAHNNGGMSEIAFSSDFDSRNFEAPQRLTDLSNMAPPPEWQGRVDNFARMPRGGSLRLRLADLTREAAAPLTGSPADIAQTTPAVEPKPKDVRKIPVTHNVIKDSDVGVANIVSVIKQMRGPELEYWTKWYAFAHSIGEELALAYRLPLNVVAGVIAVLSPGSRWHANVDAAKTILSWWTDRERAGSPWGDKTRSGIGRYRLAELREGQRKRPKLYEFKFTYKDPKFPPKESGEGGIPEVRVKNPLSLNPPMGAYGPSVASYGSNIRKALNILDAYASGDKNPVSKFINEKSSPKVWVFYQSIIDPGFAANKLVLDGHAINIWRGKKVPLKGLDKPTKPEREQMLEDYAKAASILGISVQGLQAATWWMWKYGTPITQE